MKTNSCRRRHTLWLYHAEIDLLVGLVKERMDDGSYYGNQARYAKLLAACLDELESAYRAHEVLETVRPPLP